MKAGFDKADSRYQHVISVEIGTVTNISIRENPKDLTTRIPVIVEIDPDRIESSGGQLDDQLAQLIEHGLRAKLSLQSLVTGQLQIELDYLPDTKARLDWWAVNRSMRKFRPYRPPCQSSRKSWNKFLYMKSAIEYRRYSQAFNNF